MNGLEPQEPQEALNFEDILAYWQRLVTQLNSKLAIAEARIANRDRIIATLEVRKNPENL